MLILLSEKLLQTKHILLHSLQLTRSRSSLSDRLSSRFVFYWFIGLTVLLSHASPSIHSSLCMPVCHLCADVCLSVYLSGCLSVRLSIKLFVCLSIKLLSVCQAICFSVSVCQVVCLSVYLSVCQSVKLSAYQSVFLSAQSTPLYLSLATNRYPTVHL